MHRLNVIFRENQTGDLQAVSEPPNPDDGGAVERNFVHQLVPPHASLGFIEQCIDILWSGSMVKISTKSFAAAPSNQDVGDQDDAQMLLKTEIFPTNSQLYTDFTHTFAATLQKFCG